MSDFIFGKNSVKALLEATPERVVKVFVADNLKPDRRIESILSMAKQTGKPYKVVPRQKLDQLAGPNEHHQGVIASVAAKPLLNLAGLIEKASSKKHPTLLMLDGVTDPRNFGAILRVADGAGIDGVIITKNDSPGFGGTVAKTASGAEASVDVAVVSNLVNALKTLKDNGFWSMGAAGSTTDKKIPAYHQQDYDMPIVLVMGSEGKGIRPLVQKNCDFLVSIPMHGVVESLNVSVATGVLLYEILRSRENS